MDPLRAEASSLKKASAKTDHMPPRDTHLSGGYHRVRRPPGNNSSISGQMCVGSRDARAPKQPLQRGANEVGAASSLSMGLPHHGKNGTGLPQIPSGLVPQAGEGCPPHDLPDFPVGEDSQNGGKGRRLRRLAAAPSFLSKSWRLRP